MKEIKQKVFSVCLRKTGSPALCFNFLLFTIRKPEILLYFFPFLYFHGFLAKLGGGRRRLRSIWLLVSLRLVRVISGLLSKKNTRNSSKIGENCESLSSYSREIENGFLTRLASGLTCLWNLCFLSSEFLTLTTLRWIAQEMQYWFLR